MTRFGVLQRHNVHAKFLKNRTTVSKTGRGRHSHREHGDFISLHFLLCNEGNKAKSKSHIYNEDVLTILNIQRNIATYWPKACKRTLRLPLVNTERE